MTPLSAGILGVILLLVLLASSMPVAFAMAIVGVVGFAVLVSPAAAMSMIATEFFDTFSSSTLVVIPLFVLMGQVAFHAGISRRLYATAYEWVGFLPGGLAMATVGACTAFGAICGSGPATTATIGLVALPEMKRYRYDMALASGVAASGGTLGMMVPPSIVFIVYAILTEQSIGRLFLSGIMPGLLTALLFCLTIYLLCQRRPAYGPAGPRRPWRNKIRSLGGLWETLVLFTLVMGGIFGGIFTPTEGAAIGAAGSILLALLRRQLTLKLLFRSIQETLRTSCMVLIIVAGAVVFGRFLAISQLPFTLADWLSHLPLPGWMIMLGIAAFYIVAGFFFDALAVVLLTVPIFAPVVSQLQYDPIWFGVLIVLLTQIGTISPPVGVCAYVIAGLERDIPLQTVFRGTLPFVGVLGLVCLLLLVFPQIATWLPHLLNP